MYRYRVTVQSATGRTRTITVSANSDRQACNRALSQCDRADGYRALPNVERVR
jgi:hypothetical protein